MTDGRTEAARAERNEVVLREMRSDDVPLITRSWKDNYRFSSPDSSWLTSRQECSRYYFKEMNARVERLLERSAVIVACNPVDSDHVLGWACASNEGGQRVMHYVWVRDAFRRLGIARTMLGALGFGSPPIVVSHWTKMCESLQENVPLKYCPSYRSER